MDPTSSGAIMSLTDEASCWQPLDPIHLPNSSSMPLSPYNQGPTSPSLLPPVPTTWSPTDDQELNIDGYEGPALGSDNDGKICEVGDEYLDLNELGEDTEGVEEEPRVGMVFDSIQDGYDYYSNYARDIGFRVRKQRSNVSRVDRSKVILLTLVCSCEGFYTQIKPPKKRRQDKRFGCKAMIEFKLIPDEEKCIVKKFISEHSHNLVPYRSSHVVREDTEYVGEPRVGMIFNTLQDGNDYYYNYARDTGFRAKKRTFKLNKTDCSKVILATLGCAGEGFYTQVDTPRKRSQEGRVVCKAMIEFKLVENEDKFVVAKFLSEHSHKLVPYHLIRSKRKIKPFEIRLNNKLKKKEFFSYLCADVGGAQHLDFTRPDCKKMVQKTRTLFSERDDAQCLLTYFKQKEQENKHCFYLFRTNEDYEICGVFFCDAKSRRDYGLFGDAVCINTTFRMDNDNMVCVLILGINNHGQTTPFGFGLLDDETADALIWLFNTFLEAMGGKKPISIFTNQSTAIANAITAVFPEAHHGLCLWHIYQNAAKHLSEVCAEVESLATRITTCIYDPETVEEFDQSWNKMLDDYGLGDNDWLMGLYDMRKKWAQVFNRGYFSAGIPSKQSSESINKFLKDYFSSNIVLQEFIDQYGKAMADRREKERKAEYKTDQTSPVLISNWSVEREAAQKYTKKMFLYFQEEYRQTIDQRLQLEGDDRAVRTYRVTELGGRKKTRILRYNQTEHTLACSCRKFECDGILCSHALKVFRDLDYACLPPKYYLKRWTRTIKDEVIVDPYGDIIRSDIIDPASMMRCSVLSHISQRILSKASKSKELYSVIESAILETKAKIDAWIDANEEKRISTCNQNEDAPTQDPPMKKCKGQPRKIIETLSKAKSGRAENVTMTHVTSRESDSHQQSVGLVQQPFYYSQNIWNHIYPRGSFPQGIHAQDPRCNFLQHVPSTLFLSRMVSPQTHSYNLLAPQGQSNVPLVSADISISQASSSPTQEPMESGEQSTDSIGTLEDLML